MSIGYQTLSKPDIDRWQEFKAGSERAFCELYDANFRVLYAYGRKFTANRELVMDCVQDVFLEIIKRREKLSDTDNVLFYLMKATRRRISRKLNNGSLRFEEFLLDDPEWYLHTPEFEKPYEQEKKKEYIRLKNAILELPERQKEAIYLKYYFNFSNQEIADLMEIGYQSVSNHLQKAIKKLNSLLINREGHLP
jgi:RNA polymerase sigma-70 factor (ECF subfamily)